VPRQDLFGYLEFEGLEAHQKAWRGSASYKLLNDTKLGALLEDLAAQGIEMYQASAPAEKRVKPADVIETVKYVARHGFVVGAWGKGDVKPDVVVVIRRGDRPEIRRWFDAFVKTLPPAQGVDRGPRPKRRAVSTLPPAQGVDQSRTTPIQKAGRTLHPLNGPFTAWWSEKEDLVITSSPDAVLAALDGKQPSAVNHPLRAQLAKAENGFEPVAVGFLDLTALPPMPPQAAQLGLDGVKRIQLQWGFQDDALRSVLGVVAPVPRKGMLALLDQPTFGARSLPPLPAGLTGFTVLSLDLAKTYDQIAALVKQANPQGAANVANFEAMARQRLGVDLRQDLLEHLGPSLAFYAQATPKGEAGGNPAAMMLQQFAGYTLTAQVRDQGGVARALDSMIKSINAALTEQGQQAAARRNQPGAAAPAPAAGFHKVDGPRPTYVLDLPPGSLPPQVMATFQPTITLGKGQLVLAGMTSGAERALADGPHWQPTGAFVPVLRRLPAGLVFLNISDPRDGMPELIESLPTVMQQVNAGLAQAQAQAGNRSQRNGLRVDPDKVPRAGELKRLLFPSSMALSVNREGASLVLRDSIPSVASPATGGVLVALLLPAVQSAREAARRAQCVNNLKQIGLAMHNYASANGGFPRPAVTDKQGKPLLSWRVTILPYIEQQGLYNKFKLDEPWDSPHNQALLKEMPSTYLCPSRAQVEPFATTYQVFTGKGALFESGTDMRLAAITDGTSNTLMVVEATKEVPWTKPDDLPFDPAAAPSFVGAGSSHPGGFDALFADGSVRFLKNTINLSVFRSLITRAGGEVIDGGSF